MFVIELGDGFKGSFLRNSHVGGAPIDPCHEIFLLNAPDPCTISFSRRYDPHGRRFCRRPCHDHLRNAGGSHECAPALGYTRV